MRILLLAASGACAAVLLNSCGGGGSPASILEPYATPAPSGQPTSGLPQELPVDRAQPWEQLDAQGRIVVQPRNYFASAGFSPRGAASINAGSEFVPGVERDSAGGTVSDLGEAARLSSGTAGAKALSYAMYRIPLGTAQPGVVAADVNLRLITGGTGLSGYFIGLSDYTRGRWEWRGPYSDSHVRISTGAAARAGKDYTSPLGSLYICVAAYDGASFDIIGVGENPLNLADTTAPPAPGGLTATPVGHALVLQWNSVIASDLAGYRIYWRQAPFADPHSPGVKPVAYLEGATRHLLPLPSAVSYTAAVAAVDLSGNESAISPIASATPLAGAAPVLQVLVDTASVELSGSANLTASGAISYDFDLDGDGVFDLTNAVGTASVNTTQPGLIRPLVRGTTSGGSCQALGGVSLIVTGNTRPVASAVASPQQGKASLIVTFTGTASDLEDPPASLTYAWDFDGDGTYEPGTNTLAPPAHTFMTPGLYNAKFRVTDSDGAWDVDTLAIDVQPKTGVDSTTVVSSGVREFTSACVVGGLVSVTYQDGITNDIYFVRASRPEATVWNSPVMVVDEDEAIRAVSMIIVNGNPAIAYSTNTSKDLLFVRATTPGGTAWAAPVTATAAGDIGKWCEMVLSAGNPGIGYYSVTDTKPYFVRAIDANGAAWMAPVAVDVAGVGEACSTAIIYGNPAMVYADNVGNRTLYARATDTAGSAWSPSIALSASTGANATELQLIGGLPCAAYGGTASGVIYYTRAMDLTGTIWMPSQIALRRPAGAMDPREITMAEFDGHPAMAIADANPFWTWYGEATDPTGMHWGVPEIIAPYNPLDTTLGKPSLLNLNGTAGIVYYYLEPLIADRLKISRRYR